MSEQEQNTAWFDDDVVFAIGTTQTCIVREAPPGAFYPHFKLGIAYPHSLFAKRERAEDLL
jgi:hypothetical protein